MIKKVKFPLPRNHHCKTLVRDLQFLPTHSVCVCVCVCEITKEKTVV